MQSLSNFWYKNKTKTSKKDKKFVRLLSAGNINPKYKGGL